MLRIQARRQDPLATLITNSALRANPWPVFDARREQGDLVQTRFAMVTATHAKAKEILRSDSYGVGTEYAAFPGMTKRLIARTRSTAALKPNEAPTMVVMNPPEHTRYRQLVAKVFSPRAVEAMRARIEGIADGLLAQIAGQDVANLVEKYTSRLPIVIIADILGIPDDEPPLLVGFGNSVSLSLENGLSWSDYSSSDQGLRQLNSWMEAHIERTRKAPNDSLLSQLIVARDEGGQLTALELRATANLLLSAGFMTSTAMLTQGAVLLMDHPDQLAVC